MFTFTISICCFWNNQQQGPGEKHGGNCKSRLTWVSWLEGWAWLCSPTQRERERVCFLSFKPLFQGFWRRAGAEARALGIRASSPSERCFTRAGSGPVTPLTPWTNWLRQISDTLQNQSQGSNMVEEHFNAARYHQFAASSAVESFEKRAGKDPSLFEFWKKKKKMY